MKMRIKAKKVCCALLAMLLMFTGIFPGYSAVAIAAQENHYHDPAEHWLTSGNRTNELDANAVVTRETFGCYVCGKQTEFTVWRTPEYTRDGHSALSRNVMFSDGTVIDGKSTGTILDGVPGVDAYYTGYHWSKAVCEKCGTMNSHGEVSNYEFGKNVYMLYDCDARFTEELPETVSYAYVDRNYHRKTVKSGTYCAFCFGTNKSENSKMERHNIDESVVPQPANQRFAVRENCTLCDYEKTGYTAAKAVIADYYGVADGRPHTITVSDLSEGGVKTRIRYGNNAESCTLASAPNYTEAGQYAVYYEITYTYKDTDMTENGVAYVWLRDESADEESCTCGCDNPDCACGDKHCGGSCCADKGCGANHHFVLLDTVKPTCTALGYSRYLCNNCGRIEKRDYVNAIGHLWQKVVIREATCEVGGKVLNICKNCGEVNDEITDKGEHSYTVYSVKPSCVSAGYTVKECANCGDRHITDLTEASAHNYRAIVTPATCELGGSTFHLCEGCGSSFITDYTEALGHSWDEGVYVTNVTCTGDGVMEYRCVRCGYHRLEGDMANGHIPGAAATCTENQVCTVCGAILATATGHKESEWLLDKEPTLNSSGSRHKECLNCGETLKTESIEKLHRQDITGNKGEASVGDYLVIVTDTKTNRLVINADIELVKNKGLTVKLPKGRLLDCDKQTTVTVQLAKTKAPVSNLLIEVWDKNNNYAAAKTNRSGKVTVPDSSGCTNEDGRVTVGFKDSDGERQTWTVLVENAETNRPIENTEINIGRSGRIIIALPKGVDMDNKHRVKITVWDNEQKPVNKAEVGVKSDLGNKAEGETDKNGAVIVPTKVQEVKHSAYVEGYPDGSFRSEQSISRGEAAAILARLLAEGKGESIWGSTKFYDVANSAWYADYINYLGRYGIALGRSYGQFAPDEAITRAEFTAMAVRFFAEYSAAEKDRDTVYARYSFADIQSDYWGAEYIAYAKERGWLRGYNDGSFRAEQSISRAEMVTLLNRLLGRQADEEFIAENLRRLNSFGDLSKRHWAWADIMEAANTHRAEISVDREQWCK